MPPEKLLSCPFCGSDDLRVISEPHMLNRVYQHHNFYIQCGSCKCEGGKLATDTLHGEDGCKEIAITRWNTRTPSPELVELRRDKERLDWLQNNLPNRAIGTPTYNGIEDGLIWWIFADKEELDGGGTTLRTAIDAAKEKK